MVTRILAEEEGPHGIQVDAIAPGPIRTDMPEVCLEGTDPEGGEAFIHSVPLGRVGQPEELLQRLKRLAGRAPRAEERACSTALVEDMTLNAGRIRNLPQAALWGSGPVGKQIDILVCWRLKIRGMSWYRPGAAALQRLGVLKGKGDWDRCWVDRG